MTKAFLRPLYFGVSIFGMFVFYVSTEVVLFLAFTNVVTTIVVDTAFPALFVLIPTQIRSG